MINTVFIYSGSKEKKEQICLLAKRLGMTVKELMPNQLSSSVGYIAGIAAKDEKDTTVPLFYTMPEVMLFCGLQDGMLDEFLRAYREEKLEPIGLKAVVTPFNSKWSLYRLIEALKEEHKMMHKS